MSQRIDVFISSTSRDLPEHRKQVMDACLRMGMFPIMMEHLPASDADAIEASLKMVDDAEIYLGIFAWRYGYIPAGHDISITEMEYNRAVERDIPRLIFVMHDDHPVKGSDVEKGIGAEKLEVFKQRLLTEQVVNFYISPEDLRGQVIHSLVPYRVADSDSLHSRYASEIPLPPEPYIAHPYTLLETGQVIGRQKELRMLTEWAAASTTAVFNFVVAIGGMGKSALTWKWFNEIAPEVMKPLAGRIWWSFYESDARFENFIIRALAYVTRRRKEEIENILPSERESQLLAALNKEPFLLVFDGLERVMTAYARMDAARMPDDDLDDRTANFVVGAESVPDDMAQAFVGRHNLRKTADPRIGAFLRKMALAKKTRVLVSTRLYPAELQTITGETFPGCRAYFLRGLEDEDAIKLWHAYKVSGSREALLPIFRTFDNYPLLIRALAGEVAKHRRACGDFDVWIRIHPSFSPTTLPTIEVKSHVLDYAMQDLDEKARKVMYTLAAFRMPSSYDTLVALLVQKDKLFSNEVGLDEMLGELEDRGLLGWDKRANRYDLHPIIRATIWDGLGTDLRKDIYLSLQDHFSAIPFVGENKIHTLEDVSPIIELYCSLVNLGRLTDAVVLFEVRLFDILFFQLSSVRHMIELLEMLLSTDSTLSSVTDDLKAFTYRALGQGYHREGSIGSSIKFYQKAIDIYQQLRKNSSINLTKRNLSDALRLSGALYEAERSAKEALAISRKQYNFRREALCLMRLGLVLAAKGVLSDAEVTLLRAVRIFEYEREAEEVSLVCSYLSELCIWKQTYGEAAHYADRAWELSSHFESIRQGHKERTFIRAASKQGTAALFSCEYEQAKEKLTYALSRARSVDFRQEEIISLNYLAGLAGKRQSSAEAKSYLEDVWELVERGPYPLFPADALNLLAQIERDEGNTTAAIAAATQAYEKAWCDGPPYAYHWGLEAARKHLDELGAPYPDMPPFDPSKYEPMQEVDIYPSDGFHV